LWYQYRKLQNSQPASYAHPRFEKLIVVISTLRFLPRPFLQKRQSSEQAKSHRNSYLFCIETASRAIDPGFPTAPFPKPLELAHSKLLPFCMSHSPSPAALLLLGVLILPAFTGIPTGYADAPVTGTNKQIDPAKSGTQVECIAPDGQKSTISDMHTARRRAIASIIDNETVSYALGDGETTFIIALPKNGLSDRFTFLNENAAACGELRIAVSNLLLPADSPKWTEVDGIVLFAHKRLFNLSMLGVETRFVRLSFHIESPHDNATNQNRQTALVSNTFRTSAFAEAVGTHFIKLNSPNREALISFGSISVAPLSSPPNE
jgi:hypothetical protein